MSISGLGLGDEQEAKALAEESFKNLVHTMTELT